ncbi:MAG TPA: M20 family metallopeptidase [Gemmatimonadaceae bacterium]|nr:M20 family metallopeptidase [Gemmatimonadaceae bacterium]
MTSSIPTTDISPAREAAKLRDTVIGWRRYLHQNPELSFHEERTAQFVHDRLSELEGLAISRPTKTSVVARLIGLHPGPVIAMRADMDALPITELNEVEYVSRNPGVMHACGHDGHTSMLLGAATLLTRLRDRLHGEVRFIFQHAEELFPGGAQEMVDAGVMDGVDIVIGAHLWLPMPYGKVGVRAGALMASPDVFRLVIRGAGGHAALPHETVDSIAIAAQVVTNLQHIVARNVDPLDNAVVSVTRFIAGTADNVIPGSAELTGTVRTFGAPWRDRIPELMERIVRGVTEAHGATYELAFQRSYRPVVNDEKASEFMRRVVVEALGEDALVEARPCMGGEDFSAFQTRAPGSFFFIGARNEERGIVHPHHHERFDIDERALESGVAVFVTAALDYLSGERAR